MKGLTAFMHREWILFSHSTLDIGFSLLPALISLVFFSLNMAGVVGNINGVPYAQFLVPGLAIMALTSNAVSAATRTFNEGYSSILMDLLSFPASRSAYVNAKLLVATIIACCQGTVFLFFGAILFSIQIKWYMVVQSLLVLLFTAFGVIGFFMCLALLIKKMDTFLVMSNVIGQILIWASTIFYPNERMPFVLKWFGLINPLSHGTDILRAMWFDGTYTAFNAHWIYLGVFAPVCSIIASVLLTKRTDKFIY